ncbi:hypothetical protein FLWE109334_00520 [Flavobacterium weaverense]
MLNVKINIKSKSLVNIIWLQTKPLKTYICS